MENAATELRKTLGSRIRAARDRRHLSQAALSEAVAVQPNSISRIERGDRLPTVDLLVQIAAVLGVTVGDLVDSPRPDEDFDARELVALMPQLTSSQRTLLLAVAREFIPRPTE